MLKYAQKIQVILDWSQFIIAVRSVSAWNNKESYITIYYRNAHYKMETSTHLCENSCYCIFLHNYLISSNVL